MRARVLGVLAFLSLLLPASAEKPKAETSPVAHGSAPAEFDSFIVVLLVRAPNAPELPKAELDQLQEAHLANIRHLADEGKIFKAGPFEDYSGRNVRGMFILRTASLEEARAWVATDPSVKRGRLAPEFLKWYVERGSLR